MPIVRLTCDVCGLEATCVKTGLGGVTSVDPEMFAVTCPIAAAANRSELPSSLEHACPHLAALGFAAQADNDSERPAAALLANSAQAQ